VDPPNARSDH